MFKGYKTILFNAGIAAATAALAHFDPATLAEIAGPAYAPFLIAIISGVNILLRASTNTPIGKKA